MQTASRVVASLKRESAINVIATGGAGAEPLRLIDSNGLKYTRAPIPTEERPASQLEGMMRLGGKDVNGAFNMEIVPGGALDLLTESIVRGTWTSKGTYTDISDTTQLRKVTTPAEPVNTSYTVEQRDIDADGSEVFTGVRVKQLDLSLQPRARAKMTWTMQGLDRVLKTGADSPYFSPLVLPVGDSLIVDDASIWYDGSLITLCTGLDLSVVIEADSQDVIGNLSSVDVFMNMLKISGKISAIREDMAALADFDDETEFEIRAALCGPGDGEVLTFGFITPRTKISDIDAPFLGGQAGKVEVRSFTAHAPLSAYNAIEFYSSTNTVTPVPESV